MKTHNLAHHLEQLANLLRNLPDMEINATEAISIQSVFTDTSPTQKPTSHESRLLPLEIEKQLIDRSPAEIEEFFRFNAEHFTISQLVEFAKKTGIPISKRQNKNAIINLIAKNIEAGQMRSIIGGIRNNDT